MKHEARIRTVMMVIAISALTVFTPACSRYNLNPELSSKNVLSKAADNGLARVESRIEATRIEDLIRSAASIVTCTVQDVSPATEIVLNEGNTPLLKKAGEIQLTVTRSIIRITDVLYGDESQKTMLIQQIGDSVSGETKREKGKDYVLFLEQRDGYFRTCDYENGIYSVTDGKTRSQGNNRQLSKYDNRDVSLLLNDVRRNLNKERK